MRASETEDTPNANIAARLTAFRDAVTKREGALMEARAEPHETPTLQQQAKRVLMGVPD